MASAPSARRAEVGDALLELGAEHLRGGREPGGRLARASRAAPAADRCGSRSRCAAISWRTSGSARVGERPGTSSVQRAGWTRAGRCRRARAPSGASTWRKLPSRLADEVGGRAPARRRRTPRRSGGCVVMSLIGLHVDAGRVACRRSSSDSPACGGPSGSVRAMQVAPVGDGRAAGPDLLAVDDPVVAVAHRPGCASEATSVPASGSLMPMHHVDLAATDAGQERAPAARACRTAAASGPSGGRRTTTRRSGRRPRSAPRRRRSRSMRRCVRRRRTRSARSCPTSPGGRAPWRTPGRSRRSTSPRARRGRAAARSPTSAGLGLERVEVGGEVEVHRPNLSAALGGQRRSVRAGRPWGCEMTSSLSAPYPIELRFDPPESVPRWRIFFSAIVLLPPPRDVRPGSREWGVHDPVVVRDRFTGKQPAGLAQMPRMYVRYVAAAASTARSSRSATRRSPSTVR